MKGNRNASVSVRRIAAVFFVLILAATFACRFAENRVVQGIGNVIYNDFEGGFYGITAEDGSVYQPINLTEEYRIDGLQVRFKGQVLEGQASTYMWGEALELTSISPFLPE